MDFDSGGGVSGRDQWKRGVGVVVDRVGIAGSLGRGDENVAAPVMVRGRA